MGERIERCLVAGMAIGERCSLNKMNESSLYKRLAVFRDEGPGRFAAEELGDVRMGEGDARRHRRCQGHHVDLCQASVSEILTQVN